MHERTDLITSSRSHSTCTATVVLVLLLGIAHPSRADVAACINAHSLGQREEKAGHPKQAAELFASCAAMQQCPDPIRVECSELHRDVEKNVPSVIFAVSDEDGKDLTEVRVYSSVEMLADGLDGRAIQLNPGKYTFRFELPQGEHLSADILVREGEKNRVVSVRLAGRKALPVEVPPPPTSAEPQQGLPSGFWISAGVGAAALGSWGAFALLGHGLQSQLEQCSPHCDASRRNDFDSMRRDYLIADISLGVAVASAGVATWFVLSDKSSSRATSERRALLTRPLEILPVVSMHGASVVVSAKSF